MVLSSFKTRAEIVAVPMRLLQARYLSADEHRTLLANAGFVEVNVDALPGKGWICVVGRKPAAVS